jgi:hypothetical protein
MSNLAQMFTNLIFLLDLINSAQLGLIDLLPLTPWHTPELMISLYDVILLHGCSILQPDIPDEEVLNYICDDYTSVFFRSIPRMLLFSTAD